MAVFCIAILVISDPTSRLRGLFPDEGMERAPIQSALPLVRATPVGHGKCHDDSDGSP
jgi:hypothetical protein